MHLFVGFNSVIYYVARGANEDLLMAQDFSVSLGSGENKQSVP
jgi:hypothetical protein